MNLSPFAVLLLACASGASFSLMGIAYRLGRPRGVRTEYVALLMGVAGALFFATKGGADSLLAAPAWLWALGLGLGVTQYGVVKAIQGSLSFGPLSPVWCAVSLPFIPVIMVSAAAFGERVTPLQFLGMGAGIACVLIGARQQRADTSPEVADRHIHWAGYLGLLMIVFLFNSLPPMSVKVLGQLRGTGPATAMASYGDALYVGLYAAFALSLGMDRLWARGPRAPLKPWLALGALGATGSIGGMFLMAVCASQPAVTVFTAMSVTSLLVTAMVSVLFFRERATRAWAAMVLAGVLAVLLLGLGRPAEAEPPARENGTAVAAAPVQTTLNTLAARGPFSLCSISNSTSSFSASTLKPVPWMPE